MASLSFSLLAGCSAMDLGGFDLHCEPAMFTGDLDAYEDPCAALNREHGINLTRDCEVYQCRPDGRGCERRPRDLDNDGAPDRSTCADALPDAPLDCDDGNRLRAEDQHETCDGNDNDCDGVIDEDLTWKGETLASHSVKAVAHASPVALDTQGTVIAVTREVGEAGAVEYQTDAWRYAEATLNHGAILAPPGEDGVRLEALVAAVADQTALMAAVNTRGCAAGELFVSAADVSQLVAPGRTGNATDQAVATRWQRASPDCAPGASSPRVAALRDGDRVHGVALWRQEQSSELAASSVATSPVDPDQDAAPELELGAAEILGELAAGAPAVVSWQAEGAPGYIVAYASGANDPCQGELALLFIEAGARDLHASSQRTCLPYTQVQQVALARDPRFDDPAPDPTGLALAWRAASQIWLLPLELDLEQHTLRPIPSKPISIRNRAGATGVRHGPQLIYHSSDFHQPFGFDAPHNTAPGGWLVTWVEGDAPQQAMAARVSEYGPTILGTPFLLHEGHALAHLLSLSGRHGSNSSPAYGVISVQEQTLYIGSAVCAAAD